MHVYLFNPENDLALGLGCRNYTPPPHAAAIHRAGALMPMWWAEDDDLIIAPDSFEENADKLRKQFGLCGNIITAHPQDKNLVADVITQHNPTLSPWGWSLDAVRQYARAGFGSFTPTDPEINRLRELSHRHSSTKILSKLSDYGLFTGTLPLLTDKAEDVVEFNRIHPGCFVKSPWSGSGRGVFCASSLDDDALQKRVEGIIHRQGSVIAEKGLKKTLDFATLFHSDGISVKFKGFSIFKAEARGMYNGNIAAPQNILTEILMAHTDISRLMETVRAEEKILSEMLKGCYNGWLGIDMMIHNEDGIMKTMPCIELNLRMTMGVAAMKIAKRLELDNLHLLAWEHNSLQTDGHLALLPSNESFALRLKACRKEDLYL